MKRNTAYKVGNIAYTTQLPAGYYLECVTAGTTGNTEPTISVGSENVKDGTVKWGVKNIQDASKSGLPVGFEAFTTNPNLQAGWLPLLGGEYSRTAYADLWAWVQTQQGYLIEESAWQDKATANGGNVPFYSKGDGSTTFRVPSLKCWVKSGSSISEVGSYLEAQYPRIEHYHAFGYNSGDNSGRFIATNETKTYNLPNNVGFRYWNGSGSDGDYNSDAASAANANMVTSLSVEVQSNSDKVQPQSIVGLWLVKAFSVVTNVGSTDVANISTGLTQAETRISTAETRISTLENHGSIVAANLAQNGYVKFSNGLLVQWGINQPSPITFPVRFASKCLTVVPQLQAPGDSDNMSKNRVCVSNLTTNGFAIEYPQSTYNYIAIGIKIIGQ